MAEDSQERIKIEAKEIIIQTIFNQFKMTRSHVFHNITEGKNKNVSSREGYKSTRFEL